MVPALAGEPIHRVSVFRALVLGDLLCATPAMRALKAAWPGAELTLIGLPWTREWASRLPYIDRTEVFCGFPGLPEKPPDLDALPDFIARMRARPADLMVQMHGSGSVVNPLVACLGARHVAGFAEPGGYSAEPALHIPWPGSGHEIERMLMLTDSLGLRRCGRHLDFPVSAADHRTLLESVPELRDSGPIACVHPGAQLASRRWWPERFAAVADRLAAYGLRVVLTGTLAERGLVHTVQRHMRRTALDLSGRTTLWTLGALLQRAAVLVCNDTGVQHVAVALGTHSVAVSSGADVSRWAPLDATRHRVLWGDVKCRPCSHTRCPTSHECASAVAPDEVIASALAAIEQTPRSPWLS